MPKLIVRGQLDSKPESPSLANHVAKGRLTPKYSGRPAATRAGAPKHELEAADADDVVELELADGFKLWMSVESLLNEYTAVTDRGDEPAEEGEIPAALQTAGPTRGPVGKFAIQAFRIFGVDAPGAIAELVGDRVEGRLDPGPGLYVCSAAGPTKMEPAETRLAGDGPTLLFLHGTASSTAGSFGALWDSQAGGRIQQLLSYYKGRVLAFQHRTLTRSPIDNALELVQALAKVLPKDGPLHLVSHSRGGLVGELLCRSMMDGRGPFVEEEIARFRELGREDEAKLLEKLNAALTSNPLRIERFVRVACPARGTTLASGRLDRYLSVALNVIGRIPGLEGNALYDMGSELLAAVIKKKADPNDLPGLEAMMPTSPLVALLNNPAQRTAADLHVLGGDLEGAGFWGRLKTLATDLFYLEDHDLVVNTPSMFGGVARTGAVHYWIDTGPEVTHFHYFRRADTAGRLVEGLTAATPGRFREQDKAPSEITADDYQKRALGSLIPRQTVVVLPGIMGTNLKIGKNRVWVDFLDLATGGLSRLELGGRAKVETDGLVAGPYKKLVSFLAETHDVEMFPYDWRLTIEQSAAALREKLEQLLDRTEPFNQPVRIVAHSMGGLVVRTMLAAKDGQKTWERMKKHPGARFVMLGTPNGGSHAISALLLGRDSLVKKLALLDITKSHAKLLGVIAGFDGVLQLLPHGGTLDCYERSTWDDLYDNDVPPGKRGIFSSEVATDKSEEINWVRPEPDLLKEARKVRDLIRLSPVDAERMIYVAGKAPATASDVKIVPENPPGRRVVVLATARGDGRVPWATGVPPGLEANTYYMEASHGDLANHEASFPALLDLLERGVTAKLPKTAPALRAVAEETFELREAQVESYPSREDLIATAMGGAPPSRAAREEAPKVKVTVVHGNLARATSPVAVGHYDGDSIVSAEAYLNDQLGGRLEELHRLGLYPGPLETAVAELNSRKSATSRHPGAIVIGLGQVGDLTPGGLERTISHGLRRYGAERLAKIRKAGKGAGDLQRELSATMLLIGTGAGGLTVADSLQSMLRGVRRANAKLAEASGSADEGAHPVRIAEVEVIELYEDRALQAVRALIELNRTGEFRSGFDCSEILETGDRGRTRAYYEEGTAWWQRIRIQTQEKGPFKGSLKFEAVTNRARGDCYLQPNQQRIVNRFLERARIAAWSDPELSFTLFELLIPNEFKQYAPDRRRLALVLDAESACYPWELLQDRYDHAAGPMSVESGMVRALVTTERRDRPLPATDRSALVIGDPAGVKPRLPGAAAEARQVRQQLADNAFDVVAALENEADAERVLLALYKKPYRIVHIAAHGYYQEPKDDGCGNKVPARSGVVLDNATGMGDAILLTPAEFEQMRYVPDLVFLNCCHLGEMEGQKDQPPDVDHRFAANVATQFIRMGVRAVVAAGWAVDDGPAKTFAAAFYREMLAGNTFGDSVRIARQEIYQQSPQSNTWGAYQCYGDPGFRLFPKKDSQEQSQAPCSAGELRVALETAASDAGFAAAKSVPGMAQGVRELIRRATPDWTRQPDVLGALGEAYGELGCYGEAIAAIERALEGEPAYQRVRSLERLVNFRARWAENIYSTQQETGEKDDSAPEPMELIEKAKQLSDVLLDVGKTVERYILRGSLHKRAAVITQGNKRERESHLAHMAEAYWEGYQLAMRVKPELFHFPLQNWYAAQIAFRWLESPKQADPSVVEQARKELEQRAKGLTDRHAQLWDLASKPDLRLLDALYNDRLAAEAGDILEAYMEAIQRGASRRERLSILENLRFFGAMTVKSKAPDGIAAILENMRKQLEASQ